MKKRDTLFARTGLTLSVALLVFVLFSSVVVLYYVLVPIARQSSEDLAALMVLATQTWVELPPDTRPDYEYELLDAHGLKLTVADGELPEMNQPRPYLMLLENALQQRLGEPLPIKVSEDSGTWYWADIPMGERVLRIGFPQTRIAPRPPLVVLLLLLGGVAVVLVTSLLLVRRITHPLAELNEATAHFGQGQSIKPLEEKGPSELVSLTRSFNKMMVQIRELLANRTTLLAGISHDIRTPIARMRLAIEMLHQDSDQQLVAGLRRDLIEMDELISGVLEISRGLEQGGEQKEEIELVAFIDGIIASYQNEKSSIEWQPNGGCLLCVNTISLQRVLANLIENALRYSDGAKVSVILECSTERGATVLIIDQGSGIPQDQLEAVFQPFHRLEKSRNRSTGGSGLGLAIVRQLCDAQRWRITLNSGGQGGTEAKLEIRES